MAHELSVGFIMFLLEFQFHAVKVRWCSSALASWETVELMVNIYDCKRVLWDDIEAEEQHRQATKAAESADTSSSPWQSAQVCTKNGWRSAALDDWQASTVAASKDGK